MTSCFSNGLTTFIMKQADIVSKSVGFRYEKHPENINKTSSDIDKRFDKFQKEIGKPGSATISINPNEHYIEETKQKRYNIASILDRQDHCLRKNISLDSKKLFGDGVTKRMTAITNN